MTNFNISIVDFNDADAPQQFTQSLKETGFAVIKQHPIDQALIDHCYDLWAQFFADPKKTAFLFQEETHDGLIPVELSETAKGHQQKDLKEFYHCYLWGRCPEFLKESTHTLFKQLVDVASQLLQWVEDNSPEEIKKYFSMPLCDMSKESPKNLFRIIHYPPLTGSEEPSAERAAPHEDINLLTLIPKATTEGLEVQDNDGQWHAVPCNPDWLIINTGDMLHECSNGYYRATTHRVINPEGASAQTSRLSMPLFLHARDEVKLSERHTGASYRRERYIELGLLNADD